MNNVESASAAGDNYNLRKILLADGIGAIVGSMLGSPFPPAVYIGHPGLEGGRRPHRLLARHRRRASRWSASSASPRCCWRSIPLVAILPILLYIGLVIGAQAFQASPSNHAPAVVLAIIPNIAEWAKTADRRRAAALPAPRPPQVGLDKLAGTGVVYHGMAAARRRLGAGRHGARRDGRVHHRQASSSSAAVWAFVGAVLAFVGLIHGAQLGWAVSPLVALGYALFGVVCLAFGGRKAAPA